MSDIKFTCPHCLQPLIIESGSSISIPCPHCQKPIQTPALIENPKRAPKGIADDLVLKQTLDAEARVYLTDNEQKPSRKRKWGRSPKVQNVLARCPQCHESFFVSADHAGYFVDCPKCRTVVDVPASANHRFFKPEPEPRLKHKKPKYPTVVVLIISFIVFLIKFIASNL